MSANQAHVTSWGVELVRNASGRPFWFVSRFVGRGRVEYVNDLGGAPKCFRLERDARAALAALEMGVA